MPNKAQHVVPRESGKWSVMRSGASRATKTFDTQKEAIDRAIKIARNYRSELYIHGRDGRIREKNSYGKDPYPPKG